MNIIKKSDIGLQLNGDYLDADIYQKDGKQEWKLRLTLDLGSEKFYFSPLQYAETLEADFEEVENSPEAHSVAEVFAKAKAFNPKPSQDVIKAFKNAVPMARELIRKAERELKRKQLEAVR
jgi:hypothetical protein